MPCALGVNRQSSPCRKMHNQNPKKHWAFLLSDSPLLQSSRASRHLQRLSQTPEVCVRSPTVSKAEGRRRVCKRVLLPLQTALEICWHFLQHSSHLPSSEHCTLRNTSGFQFQKTVFNYCVISLNHPKLCLYDQLWGKRKRDIGGFKGAWVPLYKKLLEGLRSFTSANRTSWSQRVNEFDSKECPTSHMFFLCHMRL